MSETVAEVGEFRLIERFTRHFATTPAVVLGPGDDAAVVTAPDGRVVACTDMLVEGNHFRRDWCSAADVGHKAAAANLADIAAMGARPTALLAAVAAPQDLPAEWLEGLASGLAAEAAAVGAAVIGGDTTRGELLTVTVTALGDLEGRDPVLRSGAKPGDVLALAGRIGWAAGGLNVLSRGFRSPGALVGAYRRPQPPYPAGRDAALMGARAMIDVSDGLLADVGHIADDSGVAIDVDTAALPVPEAMRNAAEALGADARGWLLTGGEDHALAAVFPPDVLLPEGWRRIGTVSEGAGVTVDGHRWTGPTGWDHFAKD
ncbi:thiamine-phosphate kinase [Glycomyces luteolus]|uniref:Thiamine-monophosphate kinase n=1 Tax=Glycomyces luteolus TaxID=2670330 RepID=A0A9X3P8P9_9ACTN|nr:thiamine-phosphate kinase [Glycomyces luteolus]MDA1360876.1 thiamine-phosphate kinase [Glycomyces luteolus]